MTPTAHPTPEHRARAVAFPLTATPIALLALAAAALTLTAARAHAAPTDEAARTSVTRVLWVCDSRTRPCEVRGAPRSALPAFWHSPNCGRFCAQAPVLRYRRAFPEPVTAGATP
jgi:hypothetical protein